MVRSPARRGTRPERSGSCATMTATGTKRENAKWERTCCRASSRWSGRSSRASREIGRAPTSSRSSAVSESTRSGSSVANRRRPSGGRRGLCQRVCLTAAQNERRNRHRFAADESNIASDETAVPDPLAAAEAGEMRLRVGSAVEHLPADSRRLLRMRYWRGLSAVDIARRLDLPATTVRTRLRRARRALRRAPEIVSTRRPGPRCGPGTRTRYDGRTRHCARTAPYGGAP